MRSKLYSIAGIGLFIGVLYLVFDLPRSEIKEESKQFFEKEEGIGADQPAEAARFEADRTRDPATRKVHRERLDKARQIQLQSFAEQARNGSFAPVSGVNFAERGPDNIGGRTRALMYDLNDPAGMKVWAGGVGGGLWWTNNITATPTVWNKVSDTLNRLSVTCITQSRSFTTRTKMFFGTGEGWLNVDAIRGNGIWRSLDGGATWTHLLSTRNNPNFSNVLDIQYVDNMGGPCSPGSISVLAATDSGVFKSTNDGDTWTKVLGNGIAGATINPAADLETEYYWTFATLGKIHNGGGGIWRSCDAGATWERIYSAASDEQRIEIAAHYLDGWEMYALVQGGQAYNYGIKKIMRSSDVDAMPASSVTWPTRPNPFWCSRGVGAGEFTSGQAWYDLALAVAPFFRNPPTNNHTWTAYIGGVDLFKTTDNGANFNQISQWTAGCARPMVHADIHSIVFKPDPVNAQFFPNEFLVGCDGGIYRSTDGGASFTSRNKTYNVTQFYSCAIHPTTTNYFLAGAQDNGTQKFNAAGMNATTNIIPDDHDGGYCFIDEDNPTHQITTYIHNNFFFSTDGGANFNYEAENNRGGFINAMDYDDNANILYSGHEAGKYFRYENPTTGGVPVEVSVAEFGTDSVTFVAISPSVANRVYFGLGNGAIVRVEGANTGSSRTGVVIRSDLGAFHTVSSIAIDPADESHMLVTYSNYGIISVYESSPGTGGSLNWNSLDGNGTLPDMPVRWAMFDPRNSDWAILATELGIWSTNNLNGVNTNWSATNNNIAHTRVDMLRFRPTDRLLAAATHGRGLFTANIPAATVPITLLNFKGNIVGNDAFLDWTTANEQNSQQFNIERSEDGIHFRAVGVVGAAGNSTSDRSYSFHDKEIVQEKNYYRLQQLDLDGKFEYSKIVLLRKTISGKEPFRILTNPFDQTIDLQLGNINKGRANFRLYDMTGKTLLNVSQDVTPSSRIRLQLPTGATVSGIYNLEMIINGNRYSARLIKR